MGTPVALYVNITTPDMPITSASESPYFSKMRDLFCDVVETAARRAIRSGRLLEPRSEKITVRDIVFDEIPAAVEKSGGGLPFSLRQMYYVIRPIVRDLGGKDLDYSYFAQVVTDYENQNGEIPGMYRDPRGILYHPHLHQDIPLGTLAISDYQRPAWTFNKLLFIEKEGLVQALKQIRWPEQNDCALITSKGQATRALKDIIDLLAEDKEPITVFCVHDADAAGTMIYQSLQEETRSRGRRKIEIINLGLEPAEAMKMGMEIEGVKYDKRQPVAEYVPDKCKEWLQHHRIELNAMNSKQFVKWLDEKIASHLGKLIPPQEILVETLRKSLDNATETVVRNKIEDEIRARIKNEKSELLEKLQPDIDIAESSVETDVANHLQTNREKSWREAVLLLADSIVHKCLS